jgi:hypothetical protein
LVIGTALKEITLLFHVRTNRGRRITEVWSAYKRWLITVETFCLFVFLAPSAQADGHEEVSPEMLWAALGAFGVFALGFILLVWSETNSGKRFLKKSAIGRLLLAKIARLFHVREEKKPSKFRKVRWKKGRKKDKGKE